jgi:hypothetical protein
MHSPPRPAIIYQIAEAIIGKSPGIAEWKSRIRAGEKNWGIRIGR